MKQQWDFRHNHLSLNIYQSCFAPCLIIDCSLLLISVFPPSSLQIKVTHITSVPFWVGDLAQWQTGLTVCDTNRRRQTTCIKSTRLTQSKKVEDEPSVQLPVTSFLPQISPHLKEKILSTYHRLQEVLLLLTNQRLCNLLQPIVEIALCLNCIDKCIVTATVFVCLFLFFLFITLLSYKREHLKGKLSKVKEKYGAYQLIYTPLILSTPPPPLVNIWRVWDEGEIFGHW